MARGTPFRWSYCDPLLGVVAVEWVWHFKCGCRRDVRGDTGEPIYTRMCNTHLRLQVPT